MMTNYNDGKWHQWTGGECPVDPRSQVKVRLLDPDDEHGSMTSIASDWIWEHRCPPVIAFRVVKEHTGPREFWVDPDRCIAVQSYHAGFIHVREVTE